MENEPNFEDAIDKAYVIAVAIFLIGGFYIAAFGNHIAESSIIRYGIGLLTLLTFLHIKEKGP